MIMKSKSYKGNELANLLDVAPASLSEATNKDHLCRGYEVARWAIKSKRGRVLRYEIPLEAYHSMTGNMKGANTQEICDAMRKAGIYNNGVKLINEGAFTPQRLAEEYDDLLLAIRFMIGKGQINMNELLQAIGRAHGV
jgi:hypothetical protein